MLKAINDIAEEFKKSWKQYISQSLLAAGVISVVLLALRLDRPLITISIGATVFIIFAMLKNVTAKPKNVIGGHTAGIIVVFLLVLIPHSSL